MTRETYMEVLPPMDHYASRGNWFLAAARRWTPEENKQFERALAGVDLRCPDWEKVARAIPGRTVGEVVSHFRNLEVDVQQIESGMVPFPVYGGGGANSFTLQWDGNGGPGAGDLRHGCRFGGGCGKRHPGRTPEQERKKGVPWTEQEHKLFLLGLKKHGKGDWRNISRNFVQTRTPTQVASHAQKYYIRLNSGGKDKRRSSIHDITTVNLTDDRPPSPSQSSLITNQSNASAPQFHSSPRAAPVAVASPPQALSSMDALAAACLCTRRRRARRLLLAAAAATAGYGLYRLYRHHRRRLVAALSLADAVSQVGSDLADFLRSDSDQVPQSLLQLSKLAASEPVSSAASSLSESVASGVLRAISSHRRLQQRQQKNPQTPLQDRILDRLLSPAGAGFASAVVGSFAKNLVLSSCHDRTASSASSQSEPEWLTALCSARGKEAAANLVRVFVSTAVAACLDRTATVRTSDQVLAGLSDPRQEAKVKDLAVSVCNGAVETFLRTSRQLAKEASIARAEEAAMDREVLRNSDSTCVMQRVSSTLAMPSNRKFVLDVTGRVTAETVRSFLDFLAQRVSDGARKSILVARDEVAERGLVAVKYLGAKSMAIFTISLALCMHILMGTRFLLPA